ncbi:MAG TPA: helix-turn-helix transcriptional regulator [Candidatus Limnocylindria bacterium]|jgi:transcriptional regulator with XRE-family HTH domain|nr:helix-turn-helix transcriptional regulator [Candidatus Limnocylindria bacterium]
MVTTDAAERRPRNRLGAFLRERREAVHPESRALGAYLRQPRRIGRRVTQEELAEVIGVSRTWYALLETGSAVRPSTAVLDRIATALGLDPSQRGTLFNLALPELRARSVAPDSLAVLDAMAALRRAARKLWSATSEAEALTLAAEQSAAWFRDAALVFPIHRVTPGTWEFPYSVDRGEGARNREWYEHLTASLSPEASDEIVLYPQLAQPGDVGTIEMYREMAAGQEHDEALRAAADHELALIHGRIRTRSGLVAGITIKHRSGHVYSEEDRAVMATLTELTSLALSPFAAEDEDDEAAS